MTKHEIARLIDISAVRADSTLKEVNEVIEAAKQHDFICVFAMPSMVDNISKQMRQMPSVLCGGVVGFPSGSETTACKVFQAYELIYKGCDEIDMVINIGKLKSGLLDEVREDILKVKEAVLTIPLKVIIEVALLTDEEIVTASKIVMECGATFVKTGTGWAGATTMHHVKLIKQTVGDNILVKVAGGVRDLDTLLEMHSLGVSRFGIGYNSALEIMKQAEKNDKL
ncbi:MAG: deoxyribose-phosphate aldolase [Rikenellaceae bacterium]